MGMLVFSFIGLDSKKTIKMLIFSYLLVLTYVLGAEKNC